MKHPMESGWLAQMEASFEKRALHLREEDRFEFLRCLARMYRKLIQSLGTAEKVAEVCDEIRPTCEKLTANYNAADKAVFFSAFMLLAEEFLNGKKKAPRAKQIKSRMRGPKLLGPQIEMRPEDREHWRN